MRTTRTVAVVGALGLLLGACGGGSGDGASGSGGSSEREVEVDPVTVTTEVDAAATGTATIGPGGGKVAAAGADGAAYELVIPAGALPAPVEISMAPITEMVGLPEGSELTSGVQMEPDGLVFLKPAWLYIAATEGTDVGAGLSVHDDVASLRPIGFDGTRYVLAVAHFSGAGTLGPKTFPGWENRMPPTPTGQSLQSDALDQGGPVDVPAGFPGADGGMTPPGPGGEGGGTSGEPGSSSGSTSNGSLTDGWDQAGGNTGNTGNGGSAGNGGTAPDGGTEFDGDIADYNDEAANAQLTGDEEGEARADKKREKINERIRDRIDELAEACYSEKDVTKLVEIVKLQVRGQLLGFDDDSEEANRQTEIVQACGRFEMQADGKMLFDAPPVFKIGDSVSVNIPLEFTLAAHEGSAQGKLEPVGYDRGVELLDILGQGLGVLVGVDVPNDIAQNDSMNCGVTPAQTAFNAVAANLLRDDGLQVVLSFQNSEATVNCPDPVGSFPMPGWVTDLEMARDMGIPEATEVGLNLESWERPEGGKPWATKKIDVRHSEGGMSVVYTWDFTINHAPAPPPRRK